MITKQVYRRIGKDWSVVIRPASYRPASYLIFASHLYHRTYDMRVRKKI